jgi:DNA-binding NarL/FixJ family response regulator
MSTSVYKSQSGVVEPGLPMNRIRILIVDEYLAVRQALASRLNTFAHIEVIATAGSITDGLEQTRMLHPDVILLELKGRSHLRPDSVDQLHHALGDHPAGIIILTSYADDVERETALRCGAQRYLLKHINTAQLLAEIEAVAQETAGWKR